eukprot:scaffold372160_cov41-Prasinocladus_malaysianus.AAC.1
MVRPNKERSLSSRLSDSNGGTAEENESAFECSLSLEAFYAFWEKGLPLGAPAGPFTGTNEGDGPGEMAGLPPRDPNGLPPPPLEALARAGPPAGAPAPP